MAEPTPTIQFLSKLSEIDKIYLDVVGSLLNSDSLAKNESILVEKKDYRQNVPYLEEGWYGQERSKNNNGDDVSILSYTNNGNVRNKDEFTERWSNVIDALALYKQKLISTLDETTEYSANRKYTYDNTNDLDPSYIETRLKNKSKFNDAHTTGEGGNAIIDSNHYLPEFATAKVTSAFDGTKGFNTWGNLSKYVLDKYSELAQLNPRFNRWINPMYFTGLSGAPMGLFFDSNFNPNRPDNANFLTSKLAEQKSITDTNVFQNAQYNEAVKDILPTDSNFNDYGQYDQMIVPVGNNTYKTYWESIVPSLSKRAFNLLDISNDFLDQVLGKEGQAVNDGIKFISGVDLLGLKNNLITDLEQQAGVNSDDPFFSSKHGLIAGQTTGPFFKTALQGFYNSNKDIQNKKGDSGYSLARELRRILNEFGDSGTFGREIAYKFEDRSVWYLPETNPAMFTIDERLKFGFRKKPADRDVFTLASDIFHDVRDSIDNGTDLVGSVIDSVSNTITSAGKKIASSVSSIFNTKNDGININATLGNVFSDEYKTVRGFLDKFLPEQEGNGEEIWDKTIDVILKGTTNISKFAPFIPIEFHRNYVNQSPVSQHAKWFVVENDKALEDDASNYITNYAIDVYSRTQFPNIKVDSEETIGGNKGIIMPTPAIFEGSQQVDGSFKDIQYDEKDNFQPKTGRAEFIDTTYYSNVKASTIRSILNENTGSQVKFRDYNRFQDANQMANSEPQYFPFFFRTLNRDDGALIQQPFYDNGGVFMSKRRVTGSSIVFLEAAIENINEGFQSQIDQENYLGRTESVLNYKNTTRSFGISFSMMVNRPQDVPSIRAKVNELIRMMYPQLMAIKEVGVVGFRRGPMVEMRVGDMYLLSGMIQNMTLTWGGDAKLWETIPGGRMMRGVKIDLTLAVTHHEQAGSQMDFYSPTFKKEVFYPKPINDDFKQKYKEVKDKNDEINFLEGLQNIDSGLGNGAINDVLNAVNNPIKAVSSLFT